MSITENEYNKIYNNAVASSKMEGLEPSSDIKKLGFDFINGKITKEDCIKIILEKYNSASWEDIEEADPDEWDLKMIKEIEEDDSNEYISSEDLKADKI